MSGATTKLNAKISKQQYGDGTGVKVGSDLGKPGFEQLYYGGIPVHIHAPDVVQTYEYSHIYRAAWNSKHKRHACLLMGDWCWQNAFQHPQDLYRFAKYWLRNLRERYNNEHEAAGESPANDKGV